MNKVGLGYGVAIALGILLLVSTIVLVAYVCFRLHANRTLHLRGSPSAGATSAADALSQTGGLDDATLQSYPKFTYSSEKMQESPTCSICLADYRDSGILRLLPDCHHVFHATCIDAWLRLHATCPVCRSSPLPTPQTTPGSTPLSELIPLARNPLSIRYTVHHHL
ncbi:hypothetical protein L7F22_004109 [Adiantum nelumboides]|nr:hypothetical protein [Adiantum nelumboides]